MHTLIPSARGLLVKPEMQVKLSMCLNKHSVNQLNKIKNQQDSHGNKILAIIRLIDIQQNHGRSQTHTLLK